MIHSKQMKLRVLGACVAYAGAAVLGSSPLHAQSLAEEFNQILNGPDGVAERCREQFPNGGTLCDDYGITPTTDLQMRFAAPEELAAQKSLAKEFSSQQVKGIANRLGTLRTRTAYRQRVADERLANESQNLLGGGAAAEGSLGSPFSLYATLSHGFGTKDQTAYEDEADYTANDLIVGADYRLTASWVAGAALGYTNKEVDLSATYSDATTPLTTNANGSTEAKGFGLTAYAQGEFGSFYINGSLGYQLLSYDLSRRADYVTAAPPVRLTANGDTDSNVLQASLGAGYLLNFGASTVDLAVNAQYQDISTDGFTETGAFCASGACAGTDLNMRFEDQDVDSLETSLSARWQHSITTGSVVLLPFLSAEFIKQNEDDRYVISGMYAALFNIIPNFNLNTDEIDTDYYALAGGLSLVGQGGWQAFIRYRTTLDLDNVSDNLIAAGVRFEL